MLKMNRVIACFVSIVIFGVVLTSMYTSQEETETQDGQELLKIANCTDKDWTECWCLPDFPLENVVRPQLITLLIEDDKVQKVAQGNSAVFLLGTRGAGISTSADVIAGNLSKLHSAHFPPSDELVIIDEEDKIGHPSQYSRCLKSFEYAGEFRCFGKYSKTNSPLFKNEHGLNILDFPRFDDGPYFEAAAAFSMGKAVKNITEFKLLFITPQKLLKEENADEFDKFVTSVINFVNDIFKFKNSFGLVVTKARSFNSLGKYLNDADVISEITGFLQQYVNTLDQRLRTLEKWKREWKAYKENENDKRRKEIILRKLAFVQPLLFQDEKSNYSRIWFIRRPIKCGSLINMEEMHQARAKITEMCKQLKPTIINKPLEEPVFNVKLHSDGILYILNITNWRDLTDLRLYSSTLDSYYNDYDPNPDPIPVDYDVDYPKDP